MWATPEVQEMLYSQLNIRTDRDTQSDTIGLFCGCLSRKFEVLMELWNRVGIAGTKTGSKKQFGCLKMNDF
jgi:hypothetical protein